MSSKWEAGTIHNPYCSNASKRMKQKFLLTCMCVAGKKANVQQPKVDEFHDNMILKFGASSAQRRDFGVFDVIAGIPMATSYLAVDRELRRVKMGQYTRLSRGIDAVAAHCYGNSDFLFKDPHGTLRNELTHIPGIGYKTASFFRMYTFPSCRVAVLDTHVLGWLRSLGYSKAPLSTPTNASEYLLWEAVFLGEALKLGYDTHTLYKLDFELWKKASGNEGETY
jgi:hypothetical protein